MQIYGDQLSKLYYRLANCALNMEDLISDKFVNSLSNNFTMYFDVPLNNPVPDVAHSQGSP